MVAGRRWRGAVAPQAQGSSALRSESGEANLVLAHEWIGTEWLERWRGQWHGVESGDGVGSVSSGEAAGARGSCARRQERAVWSDTGARRQVWSGARRMSGHLAGAGVQAPSRRKQRGEKWSEGNLVIKLKFKNSSL